MGDSRNSIENKIVERAMKEAGFKAQLIKDPRATIETELGIKLPDNLKINVVEELASQLYLVIPNSQSSQGSELSDQELSEVAGGWHVTPECSKACSNPC